MLEIPFLLPFQRVPHPPELVITNWTHPKRGARSWESTPGSFEAAGPRGSVFVDFTEATWTSDKVREFLTSGGAPLLAAYHAACDERDAAPSPPASPFASEAEAEVWWNHDD